MKTGWINKIMNALFSRLADEGGRSRLEEGDVIYVPSESFVGHARDDFHGGRATVNTTGKFGSFEWVEVKENPGSCYSISYLQENQRKWRKMYGKTAAHPTPDFSPKFNED